MAGSELIGQENENSLTQLKEEHVDELLVKLSFLNPGWGISRITREFNNMTGFNVTEATIRARLASYREKYEAIAPERIEQLRLRELQRLDQLEQEAWKAWNQMLGGQEETFETYRKGEDGLFELKEIKKRKSSKIDVAFLNAIQKIQAERQKLLGLTSPMGQAAAVDSINKNDAMKVYVGVSPEDWDEDKGRVVIGEIASGSGKDGDEEDGIRYEDSQGELG